MASVPNFYADFTLPGETSSQHYLTPLNSLENYGSLAFNPHDAVSSNPTSFDDLYGSFQADLSPAPATLLPERFGISDMAVPEFNNNIGACGYYVDNFNNTTQYYHNIAGEECNAFSPEFKPFFSPASSGDLYWGCEGGKQIPATEETNTKIGRYSVEERKDRILRYLKKKNQRNFNKTIKYVCRKTLADRRVRIRGRFARNKEPCEQQSPSMNHNNTEKEGEIYSGDDYQVQMEHDDIWLQEAMPDITYFPSESYGVGDGHERTWSF
ncbi:PREDICTED: uncharacterized protein LOC104810263 isoform X2 [Tarenaya hassleriana]|uniref:uncharacterized protein LOC104810263 isoform X2 n=1 Tax=Tarenaya hassleriana TaxID=28532 RepID=UPI00053C3F68|nr:PREDICTED: uncharacterized protein LOC104810263 isoform X2 [Tarenaya hassleriana]